MELTLLDSNRKAFKQLDVFESLIWTDRYYGFGDFEIVTGLDNPFNNHRAVHQFLRIKESDRIMIVEETSIPKSSTTQITKGRSLESILDRRIIWNQTVLTGSFQDGIQTLLDQNVINPSNPHRQIANFIFEASTDPAIVAMTIDAQYFGHNLYDTINSLCIGRGLGFKITLNDNYQFVFKLYSGIDRSYNQTENPFVIFSPNFGNIINSEYSDSKKNFKNVCAVAGEGQGSNRLIGVGYSGQVPGLDYEYDDIWRREMFVDGSGISKTTLGGTLGDADYLLELAQAGVLTLSKNQFEKNFEGEADPVNMFVFGQDFFMGDIVEIEDEFGHEARTRIIEMINSQDKNGFRSYPTFSSQI